MFKLVSAPIRRLLRFPLVQFAIVIFLVLVMQAADEHSVLGEIFAGLDKIVDYSVNATAAIFTVKIFTRSLLTFGFMIAYVYLACWLMLALGRIAIRRMLDIIGRENIFWLRNTIARERGIEAYRAWLPLERMRPAHIPQPIWEETYAWPKDNLPPYPPLFLRVLRGTFAYLVLFLLVIVLLQAFSPLPALDWLIALLKRVFGAG